MNYNQDSTSTVGYIINQAGKRKRSFCLRRMSRQAGRMRETDYLRVGESGVGVARYAFLQDSRARSGERFLGGEMGVYARMAMRALSRKRKKKKKAGNKVLIRKEDDGGTDLEPSGSRSLAVHKEPGKQGDSPQKGEPPVNRRGRAGAPTRSSARINYAPRRISATRVYTLVTFSQVARQSEVAAPRLETLALPRWARTRNATAACISRRVEVGLGG